MRAHPGFTSVYNKTEKEWANLAQKAEQDKLINLANKYWKNAATRARTLYKAAEYMRKVK